MKIMEKVKEITKGLKKDTMLAYRLHSYDGLEGLKYEETQIPQPGTGEILVKVHAAGVNPVDWKICEGYFKEMLPYELPMIPGWDFSGEVVEMGLDAKRFLKGDEVFSRPDLSRNGAYAEYIVVRESECAFKPRSIDHIHSAAIPLAALTAWQSLFEAAKLQEGHSILIHAAAGGVGHFAVQLAKWKGAYVIGTCSAQNQEFVRDLGADETVDYNTNRFEDVIHNVDVVLDTMGGEIQERSWKCLKEGGILVSILNPPSEQQAKNYGARQAYVFIQPNAMQLAEIAELVDGGEFKPVVENVFPLSQANKALELSKAGHTHGKIVLRII
jgi:NADPH:quinone reductase-like Zn-dependent oxidoreductase